MTNPVGVRIHQHRGQRLNLPEKTEARSAAAKKATATRAANHQALVDKITAELAEAQRQMLVGTVALAVDA